MAPPLDPQVPLRAGTVSFSTWAFPPGGFSCVALQGAVRVPSHHWVGTRMGKHENSPGKKLRAACPRAMEWRWGSLARYLPCQTCPLPSPFPSHRFRGGLVGASVVGAGLKPQCGMGSPGTRLSKASYPRKPGNGTSEPLAAPARGPGTSCQASCSGLVCLWPFRSLTESSHHGQSPGLGCGHHGLGGCLPCGLHAHLLLPPDSPFRCCTHFPSPEAVCSLFG